MQTGRDCVALFGHAPDADCRLLPHGWIALSGEPLAADLNMLGLTADADENEFSQALDSVRGRGLDVLLIVDEVVSRPEVFVIGQSTQFSGD